MDWKRAQGLKNDCILAARDRELQIAFVTSWIVGLKAPIRSPGGLSSDAGRYNRCNPLPLKLHTAWSYQLNTDRMLEKSSVHNGVSAAATRLSHAVNVIVRPS
jgi:hypothetical protein